jgi:hypothetical protein
MRIDELIKGIILIEKRRDSKKKLWDTSMCRD